MSKSFLALYRGETVGTASLVTVSADPRLVRRFAEAMLDREPPDSPDPVTGAVDKGRMKALKLVRDEAEAEEEVGGGEDR